MNMARGLMIFGKVILVFALGVSLGVSFGAVARADHVHDRHAGYYYPKGVTHETYKARAPVLNGANRQRRIAFVTSYATGSLGKPYAPQVAMFAKGEDAEKLIIVSLADGPMDTIYRSRAVLANMTAVARVMPIFDELGASSVFTFLDLCKLMGFTKVTLSDGRKFAHQIDIQ